MKYIIYLTITFFILQSCRKSNNEAVYNLEPKPRDVILHGNEKYVKDDQALKFLETGLTYVDSRNYKKAQEYFLKANEIEANNLVILNCLAIVEGSLGNNKKSIEMLYKNISIDSTQINTYVNLGGNLMHDKRYIEANKILLLGLKKGRNYNLHLKSGLLINLATSFNNIGKCDEGLKYANQALEISQSQEFTEYANKIIRDSKSCN
jgi:tetratricopeptide (TPR) repeat protein